MDNKNVVKAILHGCNGRMGRMIEDIVSRDDRIEIIAGVDAFGNPSGAFPVYKTLQECPADYCAAHALPAVVCTTGLSEGQTEHLRETAEKTAVLKSANMSLGVNLLIGLLKEAAGKLAAAGFDIEIVEKHHKRKLDAPSGTAIALADACNDSLAEPFTYVYDRSVRREQRPVKEIGISAVRGGTIVGDHDVIFAGEDEVITFSHRAYSRAVFAKGAAEAAVFLAGKAAGMYDMKDVLGL